MKKLLCLLLAVVCLLSLVACDTANKENTTDKVTVTQPEGYALYEKFGLTFAYPEAWTKTDGSVAIIQDNTETGNNITIVSEPKNAVYDDLTVESFNKNFKPVYEAMGATVSDVTVKHETNDHGLKLLVISFTNVMQGVSMKQTQYVATVGENSVTVTTTLVKGDDGFVSAVYDTLRTK